MRVPAGKRKARLDGSKEVSAIMAVHWRAFTEDSPAFFRQSYESYTKAGGARRPDEKGTRGAVVLTWNSLEEMRRQEATPCSASKGTRRLVSCVYVTHDALDPSSNDALLGHALLVHVRLYDPETSFVVVMWCAEPPVCQVQVIARDLRDSARQHAPIASIRDKATMRARDAVLIVDAARFGSDGRQDLVVTLECCRPDCKVSASETKLAQCARCRTVTYCSAACQKADWKRHRPTCVCYPAPAPARRRDAVAPAAETPASSATAGRVPRCAAPDDLD